MCGASILIPRDCASLTYLTTLSVSPQSQVYGTQSPSTWTATVVLSRQGTPGGQVELLDGAAELAIGVRARVRQPRLARATWVVTELDPGRSFTWVSSIAGLTTTGVHELTDGPSGGTTFRSAVDQHGMLAPVVRRVFGRLVRRYLELETAGLKRRCESSS